MSSSATARLKSLPPPADTLAVQRIWQEPNAACLADLAQARPLLDAIFGASPHLREAILRDPEFTRNALTREPLDLLKEIGTGLAIDQDTPIATALRRAKAKAALVIALADLGGQWRLEQVTEALTRFADRALEAALDALLRAAAAQGRMLPKHLDRPCEGCGYVVLAMGKHGAHELNYSSDIDLIVLYDPDTAPLARGIEPSTFFVRLTKQLAALLQDVTEDGYVFRVDLRLRPDPRATQVAIAVESAAVYYESMGQNWERAAMIKARPAAGDIALGAEFLARLVPYVWRKYLDYAAIADVQSLKRQIHAVKGHGEVKVLGHNIKLGRGGIREIEFFVQTQQLIAGGRNPKLRGRGTVAMLDALAEARWISAAAAAELAAAYRFLRTVEHRLQMVADEQTHALPSDDMAFSRLARFAGFDGADDFAQHLRHTFETVQGHYARLFEDAGDLGSGEGSLVFTGGEDDPETIGTLAGMGFRQASEISATIRGWHFGRYAATRSARSRELLTELMPKLLAALARTGEPDSAFIAFDRFIAGLPAGVQLFSMLKANPKLLDLLACVLGTAPRLAHQLSHRPRVLDAVIDPNFFGPLPSLGELRQAIDPVVPQDLRLEEAIDRARVVGREQAFRIGVRVLSETVSAAEAGAAFSALADVLLDRLHAAVTAEIERQHGRLPGGRSVIAALGKLGGREMTAASDLDLILVYDAAPGAEMSDGPRPVSVSQYFARLTQRLIAAISAPTAEGVLYEVDMRLRPSGNKGPVATSLASFRAYHQGSAWTWEELALTRARVVCGDPGLQAELEGAIRNALRVPRDEKRTRADVLDMRRLMLKEQPAASPWDIKRARGGLVDIEFIAQYLQLVHAAALPELLDQGTVGALSRLESLGALSAAAGRTLHEASALYHRLTQILRLCVEGPFDRRSAPRGLNRIIAGASEVPGIEQAEALLKETQERVAAASTGILGQL